MQLYISRIFFATFKEANFPQNLNFLSYFESSHSLFHEDALSLKPYFYPRPCQNFFKATMAKGKAKGVGIGD